MRPLSEARFRHLVRNHINAFRDFSEAVLAGVAAESAGTEMLIVHPALRHAIIADSFEIAPVEAAALPPLSQMIRAPIALRATAISLGARRVKALLKEELLPLLGANGRTVQ